MEKISISQKGDASSGSVLEKVSYILIVGLVALIPIFFIPSNLVIISYAKAVLFIGVVLLTAFLFLIESIKEGKASLPDWKVLTPAVALIVIGLVSSFFVQKTSISTLGSGVDFDTVAFLAVGLMLSLISIKLFSNRQRTFYSYLAVIIVFFILAIFHLLRFAFGVNFLSLNNYFGSVANTLVGRWDDLSVFSSIAVLLSFISLEFLTLSKVFKSLMYSVLGLGLAMLAITNFNIIFGIGPIAVPISALVGIIALVVFVYITSLNYKKINKKADAAELTSGSKTKLPLPSLLVLIFAVIITVASGPIVGFVYNYTGITNADVSDVRPTIPATAIVSYDVIKSGVKNALIGIGPNKFSQAWNLYKPSGVNLTDYWNLDFNLGVGYVSSSLVTTGILGFLAWLAFIGIIKWFGFSAMFKVKDKFSQYLIISSFTVSMFLWTVMFFSAPSISIYVLTFFFTGLLLASLTREGVLKQSELVWNTSQKKGFISIMVCIILMIGIIVWGYIISDRFISSLDAQKSLVVLQDSKDLDAAQALIIRAFVRYPNDAFARFLSSIKMAQIQQLLGKSGIDPSQLKANLTSMINDAVLASNEAINQDPTNYQNYLSRASLYEGLISLKIEGVAELAIQNYQQASNLNPSNPLPYYFISRIYAAAGDASSTKEYSLKAWNLKPDFKEAYDLANAADKALGTPASTTQNASSTQVIAPTKPKTKK